MLIRGPLTLLIGGLLAVGCADEPVQASRASPSVSDLAVPPSRPRVIRYLPPPYVRERERIVVRGKPVLGGCRYPRREKAKLGTEWMVELDSRTCTQVLARGEVVGPMPAIVGRSRSETLSIRSNEP